MSGPHSADSERARAAVEVTRRAIRRLDIFEGVIYAAAAGIAVAGGAGVAWLVVQANGWDFRATWIVASVLLFAIPGLLVMYSTRREERAANEPGDRDDADG